jgi:hypothetical protein
MIIYAVDSMKQTTEEKMGGRESVNLKNSQPRREQRECDERARRMIEWGRKLRKERDQLAVSFAPLVRSRS